MELTTQTQLAYFAALLIGLALGALVGFFTHFTHGLTVGLLIPGLVAAHFGWRCLQEYRAFTAGPTLPGAVIEVRDVPSNERGTITHEVPVVRYRDSGGVERELLGPAASGWQSGDRVRVMPGSAGAPARAQQPKQLRGGAIAMMLFGTFHLSLGAWFVLDSLLARPPSPAPVPAAKPGDGKRRRRALRAAQAQAARPAVTPAASPPPRLHGRWAWRFEQGNLLFMLGVIGGLVWISAGRGELIARFAIGFGLIAATLVLYAGWAVVLRVGSVSTRCGYLALAANFAAFSAALWLLSPAGGG